MNSGLSNFNDGAEPSREELMSALFANLVIQNTNMALIFLGKVPHPETGKPEVDLDAAQLFIDQIEMLEVKTKGNLTSEEQQLLKQSLTSLRMDFVAASQEAGAGPATLPDSTAGSPPSGNTPPEDSESRKKFTKKY